MTVTVRDNKKHVFKYDLEVTLPLPEGTVPRLPDNSYATTELLWRWKVTGLTGNSPAQKFTAVATLTRLPTGNAVVAHATARSYTPGIYYHLPVPITKVGGAIVNRLFRLAPATVSFTPGTAAVLRSGDGRVEVDIPGDVSAVPLNFEFSYTPPPGQVVPPRIPYFNRGFPTFYLRATQADGTVVDTFDKPLRVRAFYTPQELQALGTAEEDLTLFWFDETQPKKRWVPLAARPAMTDPTARPHIEVPVSHLSPFQLSDGSSPSEAYLPSLKGWQVGLFTGNVSYQYPIDLPAGAGGMKPNLTLSYNSSSTDGKTGMRALHQASWVGKGWSLDVGYVALNKIVNEEEGDRYYTLVFNGQSYDLQRQRRSDISNPKPHVPTEWNWRPTDESFIKVQVVQNGKSGRYKDDDGVSQPSDQYDSYKWLVWAKDGTRYEFTQEAWQGWRNPVGDCPSVEQTYMEAYKWHLTDVVDTHGNKISYTYERASEPVDVTCGARIWGNVDYSVWPAGIYWGANANATNPVVWRYWLQFVSHVRTVDTLADRSDNHAGREPQETRKLSGLRVWSNPTPVNSSGTYRLMRQYGFVYQDSPQPQNQQMYLLSDHCQKHDDGTCTPDYSTTKLTLLAIQRVANDGSTALPRTTFEYGMTRGSGEYPQGNWNRLWKANNGQGGVIEMTYDVVGASLTPQNWHFKNNRRVISRTLKDGMGTGPEHEYTWRYTYENPAFNSLGRQLAEDPDSDPSTNSVPNSATLYFNEYWDEDHSNERVLIHKPRDEFRGHSRAIEQDPSGNEIEHYFYQGDHECGIPREDQSNPNSPPVTGNAITGNSCFQEIRKREFLKGREYKTLSYEVVRDTAGTAVSRRKISEVLRDFALPIIDPITINAANANDSLPGLWRAFTYESKTTEKTWEEGRNPNVDANGNPLPLTKETLYSYETTYGNLQEVQEWQNSVLLRVTSHSYVSDNPDPNIYIVDRRRADNITNGQGQWLARTVYGYDGSYGADTIGTKGELTLIRKYHDLTVPPSATLPQLIHSSDTSYTYDAYGNQKTVTTYEGYGRERTVTSQPTTECPQLPCWSAPGDNSTARTSTTTYDSNFNAFPVRYDQPAVSAGNQTIVLSQSADYDYSMGTMTTVTDTNGTVTRAAYDTFGRMVKLYKHGDTMDPDLPTVQAYYYDHSRPFSYTVALRETSGSSAYRPLIQYYDGMGRKVQTKSESQDGTQHIVADQVYDWRGQVTKQSQPRYVNNEPNSPAFWNYVPHDTDANMLWSLTQYDAQGRTKSVHAPDNTITTMDYGIVGSSLAITTTGAKGHQTQHHNDMFGRLVSVLERSGNGGSEGAYQTYATTTYQYSPLDLLEKVTDAKGREITMKYDSLGRKVEMNDLTMGRWSYTYNPVGTLKTQADNGDNPPGGGVSARQIVTFTYDALDRLADKSYSNGYRALYKYDDVANGNKGRGQLTSKERYEAGSQQPSSLIQYRYDERGQVVGTTYTLSPELTTARTFSQGYDAAGRVITTTYPTSGETVTYSYDAAWRQTKVCSDLYNDPSGNDLCYAKNGQYTALDQPENYQLGNNLLQDYEYSSPMQRLSEIRVGPESNPVSKRTYTYDPVGNVESLTRLGQSISAETQTFGYDHRDRLTSWSLQGGATETYAYDQVGNITQKPGHTYTYDYNHASGAGGPYAVRAPGYQYDANGNLTAGAGRTYQWNPENQPTSITSGGVGGSITEQYTYDPDGERVKRTLNSITTLYIGGLYEEDTPTGTVRYFYSFNGQVVAQREVAPNNNTLTYLHSDHLGSVSVATNETGARVSSQEFDPWGKVRQNAPNGSPNPITQTKLNYTGQKLDDTGLLYYHARYYDPSLARFVSPDSIVPASSGVGGAANTVGTWDGSKLTVDFHETGFLGSLNQENGLITQRGFWFQLGGEDRGKVNPLGPTNPQTVSRYSYVLNNPLRYTDPLGHFVITRKDAANWVLAIDQFLIDLQDMKSDRDLTASWAAAFAELDPSGAMGALVELVTTYADPGNMQELIQLFGWIRSWAQWLVNTKGDPGSNPYDSVEFQIFSYVTGKHWAGRWIYHWAYEVTATVSACYPPTPGQHIAGVPTYKRMISQGLYDRLAAARDPRTGRPSWPFDVGCLPAEKRCR
ncbi:MAG: hypothetical protein M3441_05925 [Chloroflexota bacterium]|nr:hypothetical protein [Chloroflexota bacterium]